MQTQVVPRQVCVSCDFPHVYASRAYDERRVPKSRLSREKVRHVRRVLVIAMVHVEAIEDSMADSVVRHMEMIVS